MFRLMLVASIWWWSVSLASSCLAQEIQEVPDPESFVFASKEVTIFLEEGLLQEKAAIATMAAFAPEEAKKMQWAFEHYMPTKGEPVTFDWENRKAFIGEKELPEGKVTVVFVTRLPKHLVPHLEKAAGIFDQSVRTIFVLMRAHDTDRDVMSTVFHELDHVYDILEGKILENLPSTVVEGEGFRFESRLSFEIKTRTLIIAKLTVEPASVIEAPAYRCETAYVASVLERAHVAWRTCEETRLTAEIYHHVYNGAGDNAYAGAVWDAFLLKTFRRILTTPQVYPALYTDAAKKLWEHSVKFYLKNVRR